MNCLFGQHEASWYPKRLSSVNRVSTEDRYETISCAYLMSNLLISNFLAITIGFFLSILYGESARRPSKRITLLSSPKKGERLRRLLLLGIRFPFLIS